VVEGGLIFLSLMRFSLLDVQFIEKHQVLHIKAYFQHQSLMFQCNKSLKPPYPLVILSLGKDNFNIKAQKMFA